MAGKDFDPSAGAGPGENEDEVRPGGEGSEAQASGPESQGDELTVDDILNAAQSDEAATADAEDGVSSSAEPADALLIDLKRITAEYANYRRRTEALRELEIERAQGRVAAGVLPVLDDLDRAEKHGDLVEGTPFAAIAEKLRLFAERLGITSYGEAGEVFDPQRHEAIFQQPIPGTVEPTVLEVVEVGYRLGDVELRPAKVVVAAPADPSAS
ncbi:nucleotide exchange factor GrpE [Micromonospora sp. DT81.3]|uniref:nucleotide exchange factor GrpE n=1 Tax=Actinomycetes TaxID=1760 RepID=UPI003CF5664E